MLALVREDKSRVAVPVIIGAVLPDLTMVGFYFYQNAILGTPESVIWGERYYAPHWQALFDVFNSLPIFLLGLIAAWYIKSHWLMLLLLSMIVHVLLDLPVHREDAHHHFFPISDWTFMSPVSYWDPCHHGTIVTGIEIVIIALGSAWLAWRFKNLLVRVTAALIVVTMAAFIVYVMLVWGGGDIPDCH